MDSMPTVDSAMSYSPATSSVMASMDEDDMTLEAKQCLQALKEGKRLACWPLISCRSMIIYRGYAVMTLVLSIWRLFLLFRLCCCLGHLHLCGKTKLVMCMQIAQAG